MTATDFPKLLSPRAAAERLATTSGTLAAWRSRRSKALPFVRLSRKIFYREEDLANFINAQIDPGIGVRPAKFEKKRKRK